MQVPLDTATGLTLKAWIIDLSDGTWWNGSAFVAFNQSNLATYGIALTEVGDTGHYYFAFPSISAGLYYVGATTIAGASLAVSDLEFGAQFAGVIDWNGTTYAVGSQLNAVKAKTDLITGSTVSTTSAVSSNGNLTLRQGDAYLDAQGTAITIASGSWASLVDASVVFRARHVGTGQYTDDVACTVIDAGGTTQTIRIELPSTYTRALIAGTLAYTYECVATYGGANPYTPQTGNVTVEEAA